MKFISEDGKEYASVKECIEADKKFKEVQKKAEEEKKAEENKLQEEKTALIAKKKEKSKAIEDATDKLEEKQKLYQVAKKKAEQIIRDANKEAENVLKEAAKEVEKASEERMNAVISFNKDFGPYRTTLTGKDAAEEFNRFLFGDSLLSHFIDIFDL